MNNDKILVYVNRAVTGKMCKSLIEQMTILKEYEDRYDIVLVLSTKTDTSVKYIEDVAGIKISDTVKVFDDTEINLYQRDVNSKKYSSWLEFYNECNWFKDIKNVKHVVMFGGNLSDGSAINRACKDTFNKKLHKQQQMKFVSIGCPLSAVLQLAKLAKSKNIPFHEVCYDPAECSLNLCPEIVPENYNLYHGYEIKRFGMKRLDSLALYLNKPKDELSAFFEDDVKSIDVTFGYTVLTQHRLKQHDQVQDFLNKSHWLSNSVLFYRHKDLGVDNLVDRDTYLDYIKKSKYTLMISPYEHSVFSVYRFQESIKNDCLPLIISEDVETEEFCKSFGIHQNIISEITKPINKIAEERRILLLKYFKERVLNYKHKLNIT